MRKKILIGGVIALWLAMWGVGWAIHNACPGAPVTHFGWVSIAGYDAEGYLNQFCNIGWLFSFSFRHPLMNFELSPIFFLSATTAERLGLEASRFCTIGLFALFGSLTAAMMEILLRKLSVPLISRLAALGLWLSFAHVWILGGLAESFGPSQLFLLGTLLMLAWGVRDGRAWAFMTAAASGMTLTNGIKPIFAWMIGTQGTANRLRRIGLILVVALALAAVGSVLVMAKWVFWDKLGVVGGAQTIIHDITECLPAAEMSIGQRLWYTWHSFWCEPMMLHGSIIASDGPTTGYATYLPHVIAGLVLALCSWSAIINFRQPIVKTMLAMVSVDILLHVILGWGIIEGQIYCGHWFWCIPLLVALLPGKWSLLAIPLALCIAGHNLFLVAGLLGC